MSDKMIEVKTQLDAKTHNALVWYVSHTIYWVGNDKENESISEYVSYIVKQWLIMEAANPQDAKDAIIDEMRNLLDIEQEAPTA